MTLDEAIRHCEEVADGCSGAECKADHRQLAKWLRELEELRSNARGHENDHIADVSKKDTISRKAAIDALSKAGLINYAATGDGNGMIQAVNVIKGLPSAQEPLSDAYVNVVWAWLMEYQIKAAELKGRYAPYEVLSWVANDWRKEHERFNQQAGSIRGT